MGLNVIITQILMLAIAMLIGFLAVKLKYLDASVAPSISKVIVRITLPLLIISTVTTQNLSANLLKNAGLLIILELLVFVVLYSVSALIAKLFRLKGATKTMHRLMGTFGNVIFLGYPLITAIYGEIGLFYAVIYALVNDGFVWTMGVYFICRDGAKSSGKSAVKSLINPNTVSFIIALLMLAFGIRLPEVLQKSFSAIGSLTTYLSMLFIGITLTQVDLKKLYKRVSIFALTLIKMLLVPLALILILRLLPLDRVMCGALILQAAMPGQIALAILASEYGSDTCYASECVFITTVLGLLLLPLCYYMILILF
ncbi:MAG: AEC family transporter [Clostridia bacterium]|nr:AEC family transporter [Clostridia bacterium]